MADFGKNTIGGTSEALGADTTWFCKFTSPGSIGQLDSISAYLDRSGTGAGYAIRGGIYTDNAGTPDTLVTDSGIEIASNIARNSPNWYTATYVVKPTLSANTVYWLGVQAVKASLVYFDTGAAGQQKASSDAYSDGLASTWPGTSTTHAHEQSVYVSYTAGGPVTFAGISTGVAAVTSAMALAAVLAAASTGIAIVTAALAIQVALAALSSGLATVSGAMAVARPLAGTSSGVATVTGALTVTAGGVTLAGASSGVATVSGNIAITRGLAAAPTGASTTTGALRLNLVLAGTPAGVATVTAALNVLTTQWQDYGSLILLDVAKYGGTVRYFFEGTLKVTGGTGRARLWDITGDAVVVGSVVSTDSATFNRQRSGALTLTGSKEYKAQQGATTGATVITRGSRIVVEHGA